MKATLLAVLSACLASGCGSSSPAAPPPVSVGELFVSGTVVEVDTAGRRPLAGATVEMTDSAAAWGSNGTTSTNASGRYAFGPLSPGHYQARASKSDYAGSAIVNLGYLETSKTVDFELTAIAVPGAPPTITTIVPSTGSTGGTTTVRITGTAFRSGATVAFDGVSGNAYVENSTIVHATTPAHGPGAVDVVVTNPGGQAARFVGGYTFASPLSFDFNGTWVGYALAHPELTTRFTPFHSDMDVRFTIQNNVLMNLTCGGSAISALSPSPAVRNGEFSFLGDGIAISGRIVSAVEAVGTINTAACPATRWSATRQ